MNKPIYYWRDTNVQQSSFARLLMKLAMRWDNVPVGKTKIKIVGFTAPDGMSARWNPKAGKMELGL